MRSNYINEPKLSQQVQGFRFFDIAQIAARNPSEIVKTMDIQRLYRHDVDRMTSPDGLKVLI